MCGDTDDAAEAVDEHAAGVAGIERGVGLNGGAQRFPGARSAGQQAVERGDDANGQRVRQGVRGAERGDGVADAQILDLAVLQHVDVEFARVDLEQGKVVAEILGDVLGIGARAVGHHNANLGHVFDDMPVGDDVSVFADEEARTG